MLHTQTEATLALKRFMTQDMAFKFEASAAGLTSHFFSSTVDNQEEPFGKLKRRIIKERRCFAAKDGHFSCSVTFISCKEPAHAFSQKRPSCWRWRLTLIAVLLPVGGNRTHVTVPKDFLTTIALYHSAIEVLIEFDKYFYSRVV